MPHLSEYQQAMERRWPHLEHWSPCPMLGDPDGIEMLGDAPLRDLESGGTRPALRHPRLYSAAGHEPGRRTRIRRGHRHRRERQGGVQQAPARQTPRPWGRARPDRYDPDGEGSGLASVWLARNAGSSTRIRRRPPCWSGQPKASGEVSVSRLVPLATGTSLCPPENANFAVRYAADIATDVLHVEVCAPDRTVALLYGTPRGTDGQRA